jgi:hypothetical protein
MFTRAISSNVYRTPGTRTAIVAGLCVGLAVLAHAQTTQPPNAASGRIATSRPSTAADPRPAPEADRAAPRFTSLDVYVDSGDKPLAAWQVRIEARTANVKIVGVEGGEHAAFARPPYYDPAAMMNDHVVLAAFSTARDLPRGRTRVGRIHVMMGGSVRPEYEIRLQAAATLEGGKITAVAGLAQQTDTQPQNETRGVDDHE